MAASDGIEAHYERLLFRTRAEKAALQSKLDACEDLIRSLADGSLSWIHADRAAQGVVEILDSTDSTKDRSETHAKARDNPKRCSESETEWECGGCGLYLGSQPSPDFGDYPCVCGRNNRPRPLNPNGPNALKRRKSL